MHKSRMPAFVAGAVVALVLGSGTAFAATGGKFILGRSNSATTVTKLTNTRGTALALGAKSGRPALTVSNSTKIPNLNADRLDGLDSSAFARTSGRTGYFSSAGTLLDTDSNGSYDTVVAEAYCPAGTVMTGGGIEDFTSTGYQIFNAPDTGNAWIVADGITEGSGDDGSELTADVVCYSPTGAGLAGAYGMARQTAQSPSGRAVAVVTKAALARSGR